MSDNLQPLTPAVFHVLVALADGDKHGYAILKEVSGQTGAGKFSSAQALYMESSNVYWVPD
jgi:hypothetical protein